MCTRGLEPPIVVHTRMGGWDCGLVGDRVVMGVLLSWWDWVGGVFVVLVAVVCVWGIVTSDGDGVYVGW